MWFTLGSRIFFLEVGFRCFLLGSSVLFFVRAVATGKMFCLAREVIFYVGFLASAISCLAFVAFGFSGGRGSFCCWARGISRLMFLFHDGLAQSFVPI